LIERSLILDERQDGSSSWPWTVLTLRARASRLAAPLGWLSRAGQFLFTLSFSSLTGVSSLEHRGSAGAGRQHSLSVANSAPA